MQQFIQLCLFIIIFLLVNGCNSGHDAQQQITFWAMGAEGEYIQKLLPQFEKENPMIKVKVQSIPWGVAHEKLLTAFAGNSTPDACQLGNTWIPEFYAVDALVELNDLVDSSKIISPDNFFSGIWETNLLGNEIYGIPWYVDTRLLFYRNDILKEAGFENPPATWYEWLDAARRVKELYPEKYPLFLSLIFNDWQVPVIMIMENNGRLLRENNCYAAFDDSATVEALTYYTSFFKKQFASRNMSEFTNIYQGFFSGFFTMMITGPWNVNELRKRSPEMEDKWSTAPMPKGINGTSVAGGSSLVMFRSSKKPESVWQFIEYLSRPETQLVFYKLTRDLPAVKQSWLSGEIMQDEKMRAFYQQLNLASPTPKLAEWEQIAVKIQEYMELVVFEKKTVAEAVVELNKDVDRILEKRRWMIRQGLLKY